MPGWHASTYLAWMERGSNHTTRGTSEGDADDEHKLTQTQGTTDVWKEQGVLHRMQRVEFLPDIIPRERDRIAYRMARIHWKGGLISQRWPDGTRRVVPRPKEKYVSLPIIYLEI